MDIAANTGRVLSAAPTSKFGLLRCPSLFADCKEQLRRPCRQHPKRRGPQLILAAQGELASDVVLTRQSLDPGRGRISIFYSTAWEQAYLHGSVNGGEWRDHKMRRVSDSVRVVHINANQNGRPVALGTPLLEFVIHNGAGGYDKAPDGSNYLATKPGGYRLEFGGMHEIRGDAVMLIADLDDAVFGDDRTCSEFKQVWERNFRLRGSCLVYNTDRALDKWLSLWRERALRLAAPDVLIASAGTKVYHAAPDTFQGWTLDKGFASALDEGWNLEIVREAAYRALASVGRDRMHFRPPEEQNSHKITCGVLAEVVEQVTSSIESTLSKERVVAQQLVSGRGEWRALDIVAKNSSTPSAIQHIQRKLGFSTSNTVDFSQTGRDFHGLAEGNHAGTAADRPASELGRWLQKERAS